MTTKEYTHKYEKTYKGFLVRKYRNMKSRVTGVQKKKYHLYKGLPLLPKEDFYNWAVNTYGFFYLFGKWEAGGYQRSLCPSIDRIDSSKGYEIGNMRWVTHGENSRGGVYSKKRHFNNKYRGVSYVERINKWRAYCMKDGKQIFGGYHNTEEDAKEAYDRLILIHSL